MSTRADKFLTISRRALAFLWTATGSWLVFLFLRHYKSLAHSNVIMLAIGIAFVLSGSGLFFNYRWGRISIGCLMVVVILWSADMLLFIAFRGLSSGRQWLLVVALAFIVASITTWSVLAPASVRSFNRRSARRICSLARQAIRLDATRPDI